MSAKTLMGFVAISVAATLALLAVGRLLLPRSYGPEAVEAAFWAAGVALFGSLVGVIPLISGGSPEAKSGWAGPAGASRFLAAMLLRLVAVGLAGAAVGLLGQVPLEPFLIWLGACYLVLLIVDTAFALKTFQSL